MGLEELINNLKTKEQQQIDEIWQAAKEEAETYRRQIAEAIEELTENHDDRLNSACQKARRTIFSDMELKTRQKKLLTYTSLAQSLFEAAVRELPGLRDRNYETVFAELTAELPERQWENILVNPSDLQLAAEYFPVEIIESDQKIIGGLIAATDEDKIVVDNTFNKRLAKKWTYLLPAVIAKIEKRYGYPKTA